MNLKSCYFILAFIIYSLLTFGQSTTFEVLISSEFDLRLWNVIETNQNEFIYVGYDSEVESNLWNGMLGKFDANGENLHSTFFSLQDKAITLGGIIEDSQNSFVITGVISDTTEEMFNSSLFIGKIDNNLILTDSQSVFISEIERATIPISINKYNNSFLTISNQYNFPDSEFYLHYFHFDQYLNIIYQRKVENFRSIGDQIRQINDSTIWITGYVSANYDFALYDTTLNLIEYQRVPEWLTQCYGTKWDSDTSFFLVGHWASNHDIGFIRQFHPIDTSNYLFNSWGKPDDWDYPAPSGALDYQMKDSIFIGGTTPFVPFGWGNNSYYFLIQTDSLLNVRWERFYGGDNYYYELMKVITTHDGGCLLAGTRYDYNIGIHKRELYFIKVNSEGLITGNQDKPAPNAHEAIVFPNPGKNELKVRIAFQHPESVIQLFDMNGKQVLQQNISGQWGAVNTAFLVPGTYLYRISNDKGLFESGKWVKQ